MSDSRVGAVPRAGRKRQKTRNAIIQAGHRLFAVSPMETVTVDDIVAAADIAKGSFYNYFNDKEGLANTIYALVQADCDAQVDAANSAIEDPAERVMRALCVMIVYSIEHPDRMAAMVSLSERKTIADTPLNKGMTSDLRSGIKACRFVGVDIECGIVIVAGLIATTVRHALMSGTKMPLDHLVKTVGTGILRALGVGGSEAVSLADKACGEFFPKRSRASAALPRPKI